ncbi:uncharacterized protein LOC144708561 [Wolffia australiana]
MTEPVSVSGVTPASTPASTPPSVGQTSNASEAPLESGNWSASPGPFSLPRMPPDGMFTGFNLLHWQQYVQITLKGRLMRHLLEEGPSKTDSKYYDWLDVEGVVHRWLLDSISPSIKGEFLSLESARAMWEAALDSHSKKNNIATLYELVHRAANLRQGDRTIMEYSTELISLWNEIDHYMPPDPHSVDRKYTLQLRVFQFLIGLNPEYEAVRAQLIHREKELSFKDALRSARIEESRFQQSQTPASALVAHSSSSTRSLVTTTSTGAGASSRGPSTRTEESSKGDPSLFCNYCKKRGHSKETCFKLQRKRTQQSNLATVAPSVNQVPMPGQVPLSYGLLPSGASSASASLPGFTPEEVERLRRLLDPPVVGSCSLANAGVGEDDFHC